MDEGFQFLFKYLKKEKINVDKSEFLFQVQSHPDYPSLFAISDTLSFFKINNLSFRIDIPNIDKLPNHFIAQLKFENSDKKLCYLEKNDNQFSYFHNNQIKNIVSKNKIHQFWEGIVLLVEQDKEEVDIIKTPSQNLIIFCLIGVALIVFLLMKAALYVKFFLLYSITGFILSIAAHKEYFELRSSTLITRFCGMFSNTGCETVINSNDSKIFRLVNFSSSSLLFFSVQITGLYLFIWNQNEYEFLFYQKILLFASIPLLFFSIYYQKFIVKKWCPICLGIIFILIMELIHLSIVKQNTFKINYLSLAHLIVLTLSLTSIWLGFKRLAVNNQKLRTDLTKANRFIRKYDLFRDFLLSSTRHTGYPRDFMLGNPDSKLELTVITSPMCRFCKEADKLINRILDKNTNSIRCNILFNAHPEKLSDEFKKFFIGLSNIYYREGKEAFWKSINNWFEIQNLNSWLEQYGEHNTDTNIRLDTISKHHEWCSSNGIHHTPAILVNGFLYPQEYEIDHLEYFINDLVYDDLSKNEEVSVL